MRRWDAAQRSDEPLLLALVGIEANETPMPQRVYEIGTELEKDEKVARSNDRTTSKKQMCLVP